MNITSIQRQPLADSNYAGGPYSIGVVQFHPTEESRRETQRTQLTEWAAYLGADKQKLAKLCDDVAEGIYEGVGNRLIFAAQYYEATDFAGIRRELAYIAANLLALDGKAEFDGESFQLTQLGIGHALEVAERRWGALRTK